MLLLVYSPYILAAQYYNVATGTTAFIGEHNICKSVQNTTGSTIFVPTNTVGEWNSVTSRAGINVSGDLNGYGCPAYSVGGSAVAISQYWAQSGWCSMAWYCGDGNNRGGTNRYVEFQWYSWANCYDPCAGGNCGSCTDANDTWQVACGEYWGSNYNGGCGCDPYSCSPATGP